MPSTFMPVRFAVRLLSLLLAVTASVIPGVPASAAGAITVKNAGQTNVAYGVPLACGDLDFNGTLTYDQTWTYTARGKLSFHYIARIKGEATLNGKTYTWLNNGHEIDHLDTVVGTGAGFNADGTPNLAPYGGSLQQWVNDPANFAAVQEVHLLFNDRLVSKGAGKQLQNQLVMEVNQTGVNAFQARYVSSDLCAA